MRIPAKHSIRLPLALPLAVLLCLLLAACGTSGTPSAGATTTATATASPTSTPPDNPACAALTRGGAQVTRSGDLLVSQPVVSAIAYPAKMLPDGTPLKPLQLADGQSLPNNFPNSPITNPYLDEQHDGGYGFTICNDSMTQSHTLNSVAVSITGFTAYTGQLSSWQFCDGDYSRAHGASFGGCGGGFGYGEALHASFASGATTGAQVTATQTATGEGAGPLPVTLAPGKMLDILLGMTVPTTAGQYTFQVALAQDGGSPAPAAAMAPVLLAPIAHKWTGQACTTPSMLAQIPTATDPVTYWICPES